LTDIISKTIVGTAQLLNSYGISNFSKSGKDKKKAIEFLNKCVFYGFNQFDTAPDYGSELILSEFLNNKKNFQVTTKIPSLKKLSKKNKFSEIEKFIISSQKKFKKNLKLILFHDENDIPFILDNFRIIKKIFFDKGLKNFGFSLYELKNFFLLKKKIKKDTIHLQVPINYIDDKFLKIFCPNNFQLYGRSIFLQGLLLNKKLKIKLKKDFLNVYEKYNEYINKNSLDPYAICLSVLSSPKIKSFVVGFDNINQLKFFYNNDYNQNFINHKKKLKKIFQNSDIIDPRTWKY